MSDHLLRPPRVTTIIDVVRDGRAVALAIGELAPGPLEIVDADSGRAWGGSLTREERADAREKLDAARIHEALHDPDGAREPAQMVTQAWAG